MRLARTRSRFQFYRATTRCPRSSRHSWAIVATANYHQRMTAPPGWYPTPTGQQAYWDGYQWVSASPRRTLNQGFAFLAGLSLLATVIPCLFWLVAMFSGGGGVAFGMMAMWGLWGGMWTTIWYLFAVGRR